MASIILSAAGSAVGGAVGGPLGSFLGGRLGSMVGGFIDRAITAPQLRISGGSGPRLAELGVQVSTYGRMIPVVYGSVRIAGNVIWARPIREVATTTTTTSGSGGKGGGKVTQTSTSYSYFASLAIAVCEGQIDEVLRAWADAKQLDLSGGKFRIYVGAEDQVADSYIESFEGVGNTPGYRGLAYVVIEDFPLADYGNRIPNFTFEVKKRVQVPDFAGQAVESAITAVTLIPGAGEFVYDTQVQYKVPGQQAGSGWVQQGAQAPVNMHNAFGTANALLALDQLKKTCPNVEWVSVVVAWFADSLDIGSCIIKPGVEYQAGATTSPDTWQVAGFTRGTARLITQVEGTPQYGGTPDDDSLLRLIAALKDLGYQVMLYPMLFVDVAGKPWRGTMTGATGDIHDFFTRAGGYNDFILHYANLCAGEIDGFIIGSEMRGLTALTDTPGSFPAVDEFVSLAADVKAILGSGVSVTYAADWSEYHHTDGGWYHMDALWACADIDCIGIDAYFPLSNEPQLGYDLQALVDGWTQGEGYDWYYSDPGRTTQAALSPPYAWKNLAWFWSHAHTNPDSSVTDWVPESKKIWFTEIGYPSVDAASNQPNVFYDPTSEQSAFPYFSKGRIDFRAQRTALAAAHATWAGSDMVERMFVWTWDARPYPYWPDLLSVWTDGAAWKTGHWIQGKLGSSNLGGMVADLCLRAGMESEEFDASALGDPVEGFVLMQPQSARDAIEQLQQAYFFGAVESEGSLKFVAYNSAAAATEIAAGELVSDGEGRDALAMQRLQELDLPRRVNIVYLSRSASYQAATQYAQRETTGSLQSSTVELSLVLSDQLAKNIADVTLYRQWVGRTRYRFMLPTRFGALEPADVLEVEARGVVHRMRIASVQFDAPGVMRVEAVAEDVSAYDFYTPPADSTVLMQEYRPLPQTRLEMLDIPALPGDSANTPTLRFAAAGLSDGWNGCVVYRSDDGGGTYLPLLGMAAPCTIGNASTVLAAGPLGVFDITSAVTVVLLGDATLESANELAVLNGANLALLGDEIIQFKTATLLSPGIYVLKDLLRGRFNTEEAIASHAIGERFVLLNGHVQTMAMPPQLIGLTRPYKGVTLGGEVPDAAAQNMVFRATNLKPFSPAQLSVSRDASDNITFAWVRRTRIGGEWTDGSDVPLSEETESYEVEVLNGGNVVRTLTGLVQPQVSYSAAQQVADFGSVQASVSFRVYQLSAMVGRGTAAMAMG